MQCRQPRAFTRNGHSEPTYTAGIRGGGVDIHVPVSSGGCDLTEIQNKTLSCRVHNDSETAAAQTTPRGLNDTHGQGRRNDGIHGISTRSQHTIARLSTQGMV